MVAIAKLGVHNSKHRFAWRGLSNCDYELTSSLHRSLEKGGETCITEEKIREKEKDVLKKARDWGLGIEGGNMVDDLQLLADLQHFGVPTRLIDVTSNPMTALWFACRSSGREGNDRSGVLIALNIAAWYKEGKSAFRTVGDPGITKGDLGAQLRAGLSLKTPFIVSSDVQNPRLRAQDGYFVACRHPSEPTNPLTSLNVKFSNPNIDISKYFKADRGVGRRPTIPYFAIIIPSGAKKDLRSHLQNTFNRSRKSLFPDYQGFSDYVKEELFR
jgi:FRG domain protein